MPVSLAEFTLDAGDGHTYYDISLVDGYNLPMALVLQPLENVTLDDIPPNLTNPSCQGTAGLLAQKGYDPYPNIPIFSTQILRSLCPGSNRWMTIKCPNGVPGIFNKLPLISLVMVYIRIRTITSNVLTSTRAFPLAPRITNRRIAVQESTTPPASVSLHNTRKMSRRFARMPTAMVSPSFVSQFTSC